MGDLSLKPAFLSPSAKITQEAIREKTIRGKKRKRKNTSLQMTVQNIIPSIQKMKMYMKVHK